MDTQSKKYKIGQTRIVVNYWEDSQWSYMVRSLDPDIRDADQDYHLSPEDALEEAKNHIKACIMYATTKRINELAQLSELKESLNSLQ